MGCYPLFPRLIEAYRMRKPSADYHSRPAPHTAVWVLYRRSGNQPSWAILAREYGCTRSNISFAWTRAMRRISHPSFLFYTLRHGPWWWKWEPRRRKGTVDGDSRDLPGASRADEADHDRGEMGGLDVSTSVRERVPDKHAVEGLDGPVAR